MKNENKIRKKDVNKTLFRARWNTAFAKLSPAEAKRYANIIQTVRIFSHKEPVPTRQIYLVKKGENNKNYEVLEALEQYVSLK